MYILNNGKLTRNKNIIIRYMMNNIIKKIEDFKERKKFDAIKKFKDSHDFVHRKEESDRILAKYPNRRAMFEMTMDPEYQKIHIHRDAGLAGQLNIETI